MAQFSIVLLTAAPPGLGGDPSSNFVKLDGREAVLRSVELFLNRDNVCHLQLVVSQASSEEVKRKFGVNLGFLGVKLTVAGAGWNEQLSAAATKVDPQASHVIVHDAARPIVPYSDIDALMEAAQSHPVVALASPVRSMLIEVDEGASPIATRHASEFRALLHPQAFSAQRFATLASKAPHASEFKLIPGSPLNQRLASAGDEKFIKALLPLLPKPKMCAPNNPFEEAQW